MAIPNGSMWTWIRQIICNILWWCRWCSSWFRSKTNMAWSGVSVGYHFNCWLLDDSKYVLTKCLKMRDQKKVKGLGKDSCINCSTIFLLINTIITKSLTIEYFSILVYLKVESCHLIWKTTFGRWEIQVLVVLALKYIMIALEVEMLHTWWIWMFQMFWKFGI